MPRPLHIIAPLLAALACAPLARAQITFTWATIADPANPADPTTGLGSVPHAFRIATTEVTVAQYAAFLNSIAQLDLFPQPDTHLYSNAMFHRGIKRAGPLGSFSYTVTPGFENKPITFVSFYDAMRFANWLHHDQTTNPALLESGAYTISNGLSEQRSPGARYFIPSESEWYKAAYYQHAAQGGDTDHYWLYPHSSNTPPIAGVDANFANVVADTTPAATYPPNHHALHDMGGNLSEWNEGDTSQSIRAHRAGAYDSPDHTALHALHGRITTNTPASELPNVGLRIAATLTDPPCPGDINDDDTVDLDDFNILAINFGTGPGATLAQGDLDDDGFVNLDDFNILAINFGNSCN